MKLYKTRKKPASEISTFILFLISNYVSVCEQLYMYTGAVEVMGVGISGPRLTGSQESNDMGARSQLQVLWWAVCGGY